MRSLIKILVAVIVISFCGAGYAQQMWQNVTSDRDIFTKGYIQVIGISESGQSRYRAIRAATLVAQRDLLEIIKGIRLYGTTTVKDGMLQSDIIKTEVEGFLRGAVKCGERYHPEQGFAEVCMRVYLKGSGGIYDVLIPLMKEENMMPKSGKAYSPESPAGTFNRPEVKAPSEIASPYDGLVVDVRKFSFKPALVNRIITKKGEVVFDPSKIASPILVERGCGGYTTDISKAKALLKTWGSKNPMIVSAVGVYKLTDVEVSDDDASAIFVHDKKSNFLAEAKVVFVLK